MIYVFCWEYLVGLVVLVDCFDRFDCLIVLLALFDLTVLECLIIVLEYLVGLIVHRVDRSDGLIAF